MHALHVRTYELDGDKWVPVVEHVFYGKTQQRAREIASSHAKTDTFYRNCGDQPTNWRGIECYSEAWWE
jgi:hypothetical protein